MAKFAGFPKDYFRFFSELAAHNERAWFEAHKPRYQEVVVGASTAFIEDMAPRLAKISKHIIADARPSGGSMFRIYRDVRFSKDKSPYKDHAGIQFRHAQGKTAHAPGFYVHLSPKGVFFGGGVWMPEPSALAKIRKAVAGDAKAWRAATASAAFRKTFGEVRGEALVRPPKGFDAEHPLIDTIKKKSFFAMREEPAAFARQRDFADAVEATFRAAAPMMKLLCGAVGAKF